MFPDRVGAMVIDGVLNPLDWVGTSRTADTPKSVRIDSGAASCKAFRTVVQRCAA